MLCVIIIGTSEHYADLIVPVFQNVHTNIVNIINLEGRILVSQEWEHRIILSVTDLPSGIYVVENIHNNTRSTEKLVIRH